MTLLESLGAILAAMPPRPVLPPANQLDAWWSQQTAAMIGALGGSAGGLLGAGLGVSLGLLAPRGVGRGPVLAGCAAIALAGWALLAAAALAGLMGQPFHVLLPLVIGGSVLGPLATTLLPVAMIAYEIAAARRAIESGSGPAPAAGPGEVHPAVAGVLLRAWGPGGRLRRWAERGLWPTLVLTVGALAGAAWAATRNTGFHAWGPWLIVGLGMALLASQCAAGVWGMRGMLARLAAAEEARRLAAQEFRRG